MVTMRRALAGLLGLVVAGTLASSVPARAAGPDAGLVIAAVHVLEQHYVKPVDPVALLNAAIDSLRQATHLGPDALSAIPSTTLPLQAEGLFRRAFAEALQAGTVQEDALAYQATRDMLRSLHDSHVFYLDPAQYRERQARDASRASYAGVGVMIIATKTTSGDAAFYVTVVFPGSPAAAAGLRPFDRIVQVDGAALAPDATVADLTQRVRGPEGSTVTLTVQRQDQTLTLPVTRRRIAVPVVDAQMIRPGIAYLRLFQFPQGAADRFRAAVRSLQAQGPLHAVILDLRGNPGGYSTELNSIAGVFLPPGTLLAHVLRRSGPSQLVATGDPLLPRTPLVVLTNADTASSAEVLTLALRDAHRATLVGEKTAGALGGATLVPLPAGGMEVTFEEVDGPQYEQVEGVGITPDQEVTLTARDLARGADAELDAALKAATAASRVPPAAHPKQGPRRQEMIRPVAPAETIPGRAETTPLPTLALTRAGWGGYAEFDGEAQDAAAGKPETRSSLAEGYQRVGAGRRMAAAPPGYGSGQVLEPERQR
jgi:carboxyl-terminal processing protease